MVMMGVRCCVEVVISVGVLEWLLFLKGFYQQCEVLIGEWSVCGIDCLTAWFCFDSG